MSDVIGQCSSCRLDVTRNQRADYLGDHIRHGNRSDCVRPLLAEIERLTRELDELKTFLLRSGFRRCDIPACNCNSWHHVGGYAARFREIDDAFGKAGERSNGPTLLADVQRVLATLEAERQRARMPEWVSTADRLPESGQIVLAYHLNQLGKPRRIRAAYIKAMTREASPESDLDCDYDEATDTFYWPEGWYEQMEHWEEYTAVILAEDIKVTHWMPLPDPPAGGQSDEI